MTKYKSGETDQIHESAYKSIWDGWIEAQATRDFLVDLVKKRRRQNRWLTGFILLFGSGAVASTFKQYEIALIILAAVTAALSLLSSFIWKWGLERQRFQVALEAQTELVEDWKDLWEAISTYKYDDFDSEILRRRKELVDRGGRIYSRASEYEPDAQKRTEYYEAVHRRMGIHEQKG